MQPVRSRGIFGPGGPLSTATAAMKLALVLVVASVATALLGGAAELIVLSPAMVIGRFALWQPLTYAFIAVQPLGVIFGALILWWFGGALESTWGPRRMVMFAVGSTVLAGFLTAALGLLWSGVYGSRFAGATVMTSAVWVAYGWSHGRRQTGFWGLPLSGNGLAWIGVGFVALEAAFARSLVPVVPEVFAMTLAYVYVKVGTPKVLVLKLRQWKLQRELRARSKHLKVVTRDRNTPSGSDRFIH